MQWVLHVDLDQFVAAVEVARRPELRGRPVVVGGTGDPTQRGVVATASYEARAFGIRSGMPLRLAARRCPEAVFLPTDPPAYQEASDRFMAALRRFPVVVEVLGWDEAFVGAHTDDPEALAAEIREAVQDATGLWCSVGIGDNKLRAKLATGFAKPPVRGGAADRHSFRLTRENWVAVMAGRPTDALWGIGTRTARKLAEAGLRTVAELAGADPDELAERFGPVMGPWYRMLALGVGDTEVTAAPHVPRSHSRETTFQHDLVERSEIDQHVAALAGRVAQDVATEGRPATRVAVKVRFAPFTTQTRSITLSTPTFDPGEITHAALAVLERFELSRPVRLLGVRAELGDG
ncbi:DNA polymerase IV [Kitasatospora atroaurantiaca]|uniref:DNA polymerase IV n=1 Tax=Kitasatospora atroaurantiaca TaxID=285545 RepID=A0A561EIW7_9ACTN|nr:DNA polymerase IV [Kitasatospora atroaurantiaca]TWE15556.1 DNA polymerase-4 [Kitasatospora atroaurantiaca]